MVTIDEALFRTLNQAGSNAGLDALMVFFTIIGMSYIIVLISVPVWLKGRKELAFDLVIAISLASLAAEVVKVLVDRQRPNISLSDVNTIITASGPSFPSAHASRASAVAILFALRWSKAAGIVAFSVATLIAVSRVFLGLHWPSDIAAGAFFGLLAGYGVNLAGTQGSQYARIRSRVIRFVDGIIGQPKTSQ